MGSLDEVSSGKEQERVLLPISTIKWGYSCHGSGGWHLKVGKWTEYWIQWIQGSETNDRGRWTWQVSGRNGPYAEGSGDTEMTRDDFSSLTIDLR